MDRIPDSGSDDWGSTPHRCTKKRKTEHKSSRQVYRSFSNSYTTLYYSFSIFIRYGEGKVPSTTYLIISSSI